ncbi:MAG TPA: DUF5110 domain-containing protein, partial [Candidatus Methylomirabilis sp.]|nr:DUF5110 domain-containing protein [Candidatus Methylomirabilis sp.]
SNAYLRGQYALTAIECTAAPESVTVRIADVGGDRSVVPAGRRYLLELRMDPPTAVTLAGPGELRRLPGPHERGPGWWADQSGFTRVRLPERLGLPATVTLRT